MRHECKKLEEANRINLWDEITIKRDMNDLTLWVLKVDEPDENTTSVNIEYCPFCGKELDKDE